MNESFNDLTSTEFIPLSEAKAKLSEQVRRVNEKRLQLAITSQGKPKAVLLAYEDYLKLLEKLELKKAPALDKKAFQDLSYEEFKKTIPKRRELSASIANLFNLDQLSRKGQKAYKRKRVRLIGPKKL
ncbi:MAG: type II toxin-antitoxin system Phd/YefM family antitoxin [Deltaproteobacteria bacterium]|nr:type II toxin-antitoxin system Phd/YefM family antitoxin [Deltaproteobacteria bacterium]